MIVKITIDLLGGDAGPFDIYSNSTGTFLLVASAIDESLLVAGYSLTMPDNTTTVRVQSTGECVNYQDILLGAVNCIVSDWSDWSACTDGIETRTRTVVTPASFGGVACPTLIDTRVCGLPNVTTLNGSDYESCITEEISDTFIVTGGSFKFYVYATTDIGEESLNTVGRIRSYDGVSWNEIYAASIQAYNINNGESVDTSTTNFIILPPGNYQYTVYINSFCQSGCCGGFGIEPV